MAKKSTAAPMLFLDANKRHLPKLLAEEAEKTMLRAGRIRAGRALARAQGAPAGSYRRAVNEYHCDDSPRRDNAAAWMN